MPIPKINSAYDQQTNWFFTTRLTDLKARAEKLEFVDPAELIEKLEWAWKEIAELSERPSADKLDQARSEAEGYEDQAIRLGDKLDDAENEIESLKCDIENLQSSEAGLNERISELLKEKADLEKELSEMRTWTEDLFDQ